LLAEARTERRVFITKHHDISALVFRDGAQHSGVLLIDDLGDLREEIQLIQNSLLAYSDELADGFFVRADANGVRLNEELIALGAKRMW
jgi:predicted nuclease of predicted toxin-antitoxin system